MSKFLTTMRINNRESSSDSCLDRVYQLEKELEVVKAQLERADMIGEKFGIVEVVEILPINGSFCIVKCECGKTRKVLRDKFKECQIASCGDTNCKRKLREMRKKYRTKFGCGKNKE